MNEAQDPLSQLRDIHLPDPVSSWPPAPGWWLLLVLVMVLLAVAWFTYHWFKNKGFRRLKLRKAALYELQRYCDETGDQQDLCGRYMQLSILLRRLAISLFGGDRVAGLTGERWLGFLDETGGTDFFSRGPGRSLLTVPYGGVPETEAEDAKEKDGNGASDVTLLVDQIRVWVVKNT